MKAAVTTPPPGGALDRPYLRGPLFLLVAIAVNILIAYAVFRMVTLEDAAPPDREKLRLVDFVRLAPTKEAPPAREEELPEPPPPLEEPPPPQETQPALPDEPPPPQLEMPQPAFELPLNLVGQPHLGDVRVAPAPAPTAAMPAPAPTRAPTGPAAPLQTGIEENLVPTFRLPPVYPPRALRAGIEGVVTVEFTIRGDGSVADPQVVKASPPKVFDDAVLRAILKWKFQPKLVEGKPVERRARQDVKFTLNDQ